MKLSIAVCGMAFGISSSVQSAVVLTALHPNFFDPPFLTVPPNDLRVGHAPSSGPSGPSYVQTIDFDGDGSYEIRLSGDGGEAVIANYASNVEILGIDPAVYGLSNYGIWVWPYSKTDEIAASAGNTDVEWYLEGSDGPVVLWGAIGAQVATATPWGAAIWNGNPNPYMGVRFAIEDGWHYGYVRVGYRTGPVGWLMGYAWETEPDTPILAGAVPEPGTWWLILASGGLAIYRRRRRRLRLAFS